MIGTKRVEVISLDKREFLKQLSDTDTQKYEKLCELYTDIVRDGKNLAHEMSAKKVQLNAFLDGAALNPTDKNLRSQDTNHSWLDYRSHGLKAQRIQNNIRNFVHQIKSRKNCTEMTKNDVHPSVRKQKEQE